MQRSEVTLVLQFAAFGRIEVVDSVAEVFFDLAAHNLHRTVDQTVALRKGLVDNGQAGRKPPFREFAGKNPARSVAVDFAAQNRSRNGSAFCRSRTARIEFAEQRLAVGHDDGTREGALVVVNQNLVDEGRLVDDGLLHPFGAVLLAVGGDEQALEAAQHVEEFILRDISHVARVEPSVAHGLGRRLGILPVAGHDILAADDDFALLAARKFASLLVDDFQVERNENLARRAKAVPVILGRVGRDDGRRLRKAVSLEHRDADGVEETLQLGIEQRTAADKELQAAAEGLADLAEEHQVEELDRGPEHETPPPAAAVAVLIVAVGRPKRQLEEPLRGETLGADGTLDVLAEILGQRRHRKQEVGAYFADVERDILERLHRRGTHLHRSDRRSAGNHDVESHDMGETVVQRQDDERTVRRRDVDARERLLDVGRIVAVRQHDTLGVGRGARRIGDGRVVVVADGAADGEELVAVVVQIGAAEALERSQRHLARLERNMAEDDDVLQFGQLADDAADFRQLVLRDEDGLYLGMAEAEQQVVRLLELDRQRHAHAAGIEEAQFRDNPGVAPFREDGDLLLGPDTDGGQAGAHLERLLAGFGIGRRFELVVTLLEQEGLLSVPGDRRLEEVDDGFLHGLIHFEDGEEGRLGNLDVADLTHAFLASLLLLQQLALTRDIAAVALGRHILAHGLHRLAGDDFGADGRLDGDVELLTRDELLELLAHLAAEVIGMVGIDERREGIDRLAVEQDVQLGEFRQLVARTVVVERGVTLRDALELVVEIEDNLRKRHVEIDFHTVLRNEGLVLHHAALVDAELDDVAQEVRLGDNLGQDIGLLDFGYFRDFGQSRGVVHLERIALRGGNAVGDVRHGGDDIHVEFAVESLLDNLHVEQPEESAAESEAERQRALGLERERSVVELQLLERGAQVLVLVGLDGIDTGEDHRLDILESGDGLAGGIVHRGNRIADLHIGRSLDARADVTHIAGADLVAGLHLEFQHAHLVGIVFAARIEELDVVALAQRTVEDAVVGDDAAEGVEHRVENQRLQRGVLVALRRRYAVDDGLEHLLDSHARLARRQENILILASQQVDDLVLHLVNHGRIHVDFVQHGDDFEVVAHGQVEVRNGLRLNTLRGIDNQQRTFARGNRARNLVGEVDVSRRIDEVERIEFSVGGTVLHLDGVALDGDALLALELHVVEHLSLHLPAGKCACFFYNSVRECRFTVINMGNNTKIADFALIY